MKRLIFLLPLLITLDNSYAQTDYAELEWVRKYLRPREDSPVGLAKAFTIDDCGNSYVAIDDLYCRSSDSSDHSDYVVIKYNSIGNEELVLRYSPSDSSNQLSRLAIDKDRNIYIAGSAKYGSLYKTLKYTLDGNLQWVATDSSGLIFVGTTIPTGLAIDTLGNVFMTSQTGEIFKYNSMGKRVWEVPKDGRQNASMVLDNNANIYLVRSGIVAKYDTHGMKKWEVCDTLVAQGGSIQVNCTGDVYICGIFGLSKYNVEGTKQWSVLYGEGHYGYYLVLDNSGDPIVFGGYYNGLYDQYAMIKYDLDGVKLWEALYAGPLPGPFGMGRGPRDLCIDRFNNIYVTGSSYSENGTWDIIVIKYSPKGEEKWVIRYDDYPADEYPQECKRERQPIAIRVDTCGNVYVAGHNLMYCDEPKVIVTLKYKQPNFSNYVNSEETNVFKFNLYTNYPNPFNPTTTISFSLPLKSSVSLKVFDLIGREVATLISNELSAGNHSMQWNAEKMPSGVYFYRLQARQIIDGQAGSFTETKKILLLR
jgi:hypothetical protein